MKIPFVDLTAQYESIKPQIDNAIQQVISETAFIGGKFVKQFEDDFASIYGVKHVISCANGTDSLYIIMKMLGIGNGDEVITVSNSWISSSETITQTGATPVFVDIDPVYDSIDASKIESAITPKTKAIIAVHLQGQMCAMDEIVSICERHSIELIEDCAQSHFSEYKGKRAGLFGIAGSFSFYPGKNLGAYGDAGCIITSDDFLAEKCRMYARHGALKKHQHQIEGINSRLDGLQAAILLAKLPYILDWTDRRIKNAELYNEYLRDEVNVRLPETRPQTKHTFHLYVIKVKHRQELMKYLLDNGIETVIHYPTPLPMLPCYSYLNVKEERFNIARKLQPEILSLPMYAELSEDSIKQIANCIKAFYRNRSNGA